MKHKVVRVDNLMYDGCEPHWKCIYCNKCYPFHCYSKRQIEQMECRIMTRPEVTKFLSDLTEKHICPNKADTRIYWAKEVSFDYGTENAIRVDYMKFKPVNNTVSGIEKGDFYCYEIKSSIEDFNSKHGHNFIGDYNYYVMPEDVYKTVETKIHHTVVGVYVPDSYGGLKSIKKAKRVDRHRPMIEMLLMMFRSANRDRRI